MSLLSLLAVVALGTVAVAFVQMSATAPEAGSVPRTPIMTPEPEPEPTPEPEPVPVYVAPAMQRILAISPFDADHVLRGWVGSCPDPAGALEVTFDGGESWEPGIIASVDARKLLQADLSGDEIVRIAAQVGDCSPQVARSFMGGTAWELDPAAPAMWFIDPGDTTQIHTPAGVHTLECEAVGLSAVESRAAVLCSDSTVVFSENSGEGWSAPIAVPQAIAVGTVAEGFAVASFGEDECAGVRTRFISAGALGGPGACLDIADAGGGQTALAGGDGGWIMWSGGSMLRSNDLGGTWG